MMHYHLTIGMDIEELVILKKLAEDKNFKFEAEIETEFLDVEEEAAKIIKRVIANLLYVAKKMQ